MDSKEYNDIVNEVISRVREKTNAIIDRKFLDDYMFEHIVEDVMNMSKAIGLEGYRLYTFVDDILTNIAFKMYIKNDMIEAERCYMQAHQDDDDSEDEDCEDEEGCD